MSSIIAQIEHIAGQTVRRDISRLVAFARGNLALAAQSIAEHPAPHVGIVCGFFVRHGEPPSPETDGLNGMGQLAAGLAEAGIPVTVITDAPCAKAAWAVIEVLPGEVDLQVVAVSAVAVRRLRSQLEAADRPLTHLIAIERCSFGADGKPHREHGWDISNDTAPMEYLFQDDGWTPGWKTIGIGDGCNEIGMGVLPKELVESDVPNGKLIAATTPADFLIVSGVANWGAYALLGAIASLRPDLAARLLTHFNGAMERAILKSAVELGQAIDDSRTDRLGQLQMTIDRLPLEDHIRIIEQIAAALDEPA
ncbi:glutamate cyclase domain-containing protein [Paraburkholderia sp. RL17-337-BIB-A]|uniref:glutamate cyclase domain-containing protein n=1 Tax=Paraburkholderia sp. RL17-337-BIB-A TaxID=3031636 RepID=UPI0038BB81CE